MTEEPLVILRKSEIRWILTLITFACAPICIPAPAEARTYYVGPVDRPTQVALANQLGALEDVGGDAAGINRRGRAILSDAFHMFKGGRFEKHFPNGFYLDLSRDDIRRVARNYVLSNAKNRDGYLQELKYLNLLAQPESPFDVLEVGGRAPISSGRVVEFDARLKDKRTGLPAASEFKNWRISNRSQVEAAKDQMNKIAMRAREEKVPRAIWVNRQPVPDSFRSDLERYAAKRNMGFYDDISTGSSTKSRRLSEVLEKESDSLKKHDWTKATGRTIGIAAALYGTGNATYAAYAWQRGGMTTRTATVAASEGAGAAVGGLTFALLGAKLGAFGGPVAWITIPAGGVVGGVFGAFCGGAGGKAAGQTLVDQVIFKDLEHNETTAVIAHLREQY
jgi:hypothetical protein